MSTQTTEHAFESHVEATLLLRGWRRGGLAEWDVERALFPARVCAFIEATQPEPWAAMRALHGAGLEELLVDALVRELDVKGALHVLRHGFKFYGRTFRLAWFRPAHGRNDETLAFHWSIHGAPAKRSDPASPPVSRSAPPLSALVACLQYS